MRARQAAAAALAILALGAALLRAAPAGDALAHDAVTAAAGASTESGAAEEAGLIAALRAKGARVLALGERGGLDGHFVELADGGAYGLYLTPDGHAVAGLLYGPDGALLTGRQIAGAGNERGGAAARLRGREAALRPGRRAGGAGNEGGGAAAEPAPARDVGGGTTVSGARHGGAPQLAHALAGDPAASNRGTPRYGGSSGSIEALFERSVAAFGFTLGRDGPAVAVFADPGCRWSRAAVARLARPALDGRLLLRVIPVGVLGAASAREAAVIASAGDPAMTWFEGGGWAASPQGARRIERNNALFDAWGAGAVPLIAWRARDGGIGHRVGDIDDVDAWLEALRHE